TERLLAGVRRCAAFRPHFHTAFQIVAGFRGARAENSVNSATKTLRIEHPQGGGRGPEKRNTRCRSGGWSFCSDWVWCWAAVCNRLSSPPPKPTSRPGI